MASARVFAAMAAVVVASAWAVPAGATSLTNGDFSAGLTGWTVAAPGGPVTPVGGKAVLAEDPVYILTSLQQQFTIPAGTYELSFRLELTSLPGGLGGSLTPDAFAASLLDPATLNPIISESGFSDYFYQDSAGVVSYDPASVVVSGSLVTAYLPTFAADRDVLLTFDLTGSDNDLMTQATVDDVALQGGPGAVPEPLTLVGVPLALMSLAGYLRRRRAIA